MDDRGKKVVSSTVEGIFVDGRTKIAVRPQKKPFWWMAEDRKGWREAGKGKKLQYMKENDYFCAVKYKKT